MAMLPRASIAAVCAAENFSLCHNRVRWIPATMRRVFGPQLTLFSLSDVKAYSPGGRDPMARVARQSGSGLFLHASLPEIAHAIVMPLNCGSSLTTNSRPVEIV